MSVADYAKEVLVETQWVQEHLNDDSIRIVEGDETRPLSHGGFGSTLGALCAGVPQAVQALEQIAGD